MASSWDERVLRRTLLIQRIGIPPNATYRLNGFMRVSTLDGDSFLEPIPGGEVSLPHQGIIFAAVEFIDPPISGQLIGGDTNLTRNANDMTLRLTA